MQQEAMGMLSPYRALDLTDETGLYCGRVLADLGVDVIKLERPGGDLTRNRGPFYKDIPHPENSLFWMSYNLGKRGITLNLETDDGKDIFKRLIRTADFVIESYPPGGLSRLGLDFAVLSEINPRVIVTSITPFGQCGPYRDYKSCDLVNMAMGGLMYTTGAPHQPPLRISVPQTCFIAGATAAFATLVAHYHREKTGLGQHVDVSVQAAVALLLSNWIPLWEIEHENTSRTGPYIVSRFKGPRKRVLWPCKDGYITFQLMGSKVGERTNKTLVEWMGREGMAPDFMKQMDWARLDMSHVSQEQADLMEEAFANFFKKHTQAELADEAIREQIMVFPVLSPGEIVKNAQLKDREFWLQVPHPEKNMSITYPGFFIKASKAPCSVRGRAPLVGEHNIEVYEKELRLSRDTLTALREANII